ncbi:1,6-anhydro-N-acetylmuramyl-L-alanine amidase AmpD [Thalassotalea profundi]|uniref:1,6-anhydro-N-acetylmuramyl-L-alanine amidase AmpD n=1 Tax=Thalassotalea profundi TaxID=2036687 RepID=A0ABQ3IWI1_9GAMM|nr:1,6-anhydro-N-acetylmuramyl-L-alanine amidase AmpD [Thalassotalea profundi]GHE95020.1 N-acetyl-anhydromuranmyl-L-alanine amidase [Thalassotalea profundi]
MPDVPILKITNGWLDTADKIPSPHFNARPENTKVSLLVVHNISLPPGKFGGNYITDLFLGQLDEHAHPYFSSIYQLKVSAHCLIQRDGNIIQYVSFDDRAWHAGVSIYKGKAQCNDFSIGIELEGTDEIPYTDEQYQQLSRLTASIKQVYPDIDDDIVGHCDIAPGRKTDPGKAFDWQYYQLLLTKQ